ncbi:MAG: hypothetical protein AAGB01_10560, partial [Cyanobacteria bacterium P01_F01_bin.42]
MNDAQSITNESENPLQSNPEYEAINDQILAWTNGQPLLTDYLWDQLGLLNADAELSAVDADTVNQLVQQNFSIHPSQISGFPNAKVRQLLSGIYLTLVQGEKSLDVLQRYGEIYQARGGLPAREDSVDKVLLSSQLVTENPNATVFVSCLIFRKIFGQDWLAAEIKRKRRRGSLDKYHLALLAGLVSIFLVILG